MKTFIILIWGVCVLSNANANLVKRPIKIPIKAFDVKFVLSPNKASVIKDYFKGLDSGQVTKWPSVYRPNFQERAMGDFVGNGGGLVEAQFSFYLYNLRYYIQEALLNLDLDGEEKEDLGKILEVAISASFNPAKLQFVSGKDFPELFIVSDSQNVRLAVTGGSPETPIFINSDLLYNQSERPAIGRDLIITNLVHELGHNAGIVEREESSVHTYLDYLGAKVSSLVGRDRFSTELIVKDWGRFDVELINFSSGFSFPSFMLKFNDQIINLQRPIKEGLHCGEQSSPIGAKYSNIHWGRERTNQTERSVKLYGWAEVTCFDGRYESSEQIDFELTISSNKENSMGIESISFN